MKKFLVLALLVFEIIACKTSSGGSTAQDFSDTSGDNSSRQAALCKAQIKAEAFSHWRDDGGSDNSPQISIRAQGSSTYTVVMSGEETGEFTYSVATNVVGDQCQTSWKAQSTDGSGNLSNATSNCRTQIKNEAFKHWRNDGGADNFPNISIKSQGSGTYKVAISGDETGELDYLVTVKTSGGACQTTKWTLTQNN